MRSNRYASIMLLLALLAGCETPVGPDIEDPPIGDEVAGPPEFLLQAWIWVIAPNAMRTYDFTQLQAAGRRTVEIRGWQQIGTLGWQSNQAFTADFTANTQEISIVSPTGYRESWVIVDRESYGMVVERVSTGEQSVWYNCEAEGWPALIYASMRGCR